MSEPLIIKIEGKESFLYKQASDFFKTFKLNLKQEDHVTFFRNWMRSSTEKEFGMRRFDLIIESKGKVYGFSHCLPLDGILDTDGSLHVKLGYDKKLTAQDNAYIRSFERARKIKALLA